jgi:hypothetical protein
MEEVSNESELNQMKGNQDIVLMRKWKKIKKKK